MLPSAFLAAGLLATAGSAFKIKAYNDPTCEGDYKEINIWDNTCRGTGDYPFTHFVLESYGSDNQRGTFYQSQNTCLDYGTKAPSYWVGGHSDGMVKGRCYDLGITAEAVGSRLV